jgi:hypothetical protein
LGTIGITLLEHLLAGHLRVGPQDADALGVHILGDRAGLGHVLAQLVVADRAGRVADQHDLAHLLAVSCR